MKIIRKCLILFLLSLSVLSAAAYDDLLPLRDGLETVPMPDLETLEPAVKDQVMRSRQSLERLSQNEGNQKGLALSYARLGQIFQAYALDRPASACYRNALVLQPDQFAWMYYLGLLAKEAGDVDKAKSYFEKAADVDAEYAALWGHLGQIHLDNQAFDAAEKAFQKEKSLVQYHPHALYGLGRVAMGQKQFDTAIDYFKETLKLLPAANRVYYSLGMAYRGKGNRELAAFCLERAGKIGPRSLDPLLSDVQRMARGERVYLIQAKTSFEAGDYQSSRKLFSKAAETNPRNVAAQVGLGSSHGALGQTEEALAAYGRALELEPENLTALYNTGLILKRDDRADEAESYLVTVVQRNPADHFARYELAGIYADSGRLEIAAGHYRRLTMDKRNWKLPWLRLSEVASQMESYEAAKNALSEAQDLFEDDEITRALTDFLISCPDPFYRAPLWAVEMSQELVEKERSAVNVILLARSYAEAGQCEGALRELGNLIPTLSNETDATVREQAQKLLTLYQSEEGCNSASP